MGSASATFDALANWLSIIDSSERVDKLRKKLPILVVVATSVLENTLKKQQRFRLCTLENQYLFVCNGKAVIKYSECVHFSSIVVALWRENKR